jgi:hypothetical protein
MSALLELARGIGLAFAGFILIASVVFAAKFIRGDVE